MELVLGNQPNLPFRLRVCSERSSMDELEPGSNRSYYLEVTPPDTIDEQKDTVLIPVAQYTKVRENGRWPGELIRLSLGKLDSNQCGQVLSVLSSCDTCNERLRSVHFVREARPLS